MSILNITSVKIISQPSELGAEIELINNSTLVQCKTVAWLQTKTSCFEAEESIYIIETR